MRYPLLAAFLVVTTLVACDGDPDPGIDADLSADADVGPDGPETPDGGGPDAPEAVFDAAIDAAPDDAAIDAAPDDAAIDAASDDAAVDAAPDDAAVDGSPDATPILPEDCHNQLDDDLDGAIDCADTDCTVACLTACPTGQLALTIPATGLPLPVGGSATPRADVDFAVAQTGVVTGVAVRFTLPHTFASDLDISLRSPAGTTLDLASDVGGGGDNFTSTVLTDSAAAVIGSTGNNTAPFTGSFRPEQPFAGLAYQLAPGTWRFSAVDDAPADTDVGNLASLELMLCICDGIDGCERALACNDGIDDDGDDLIDCADPDCGSEPRCIPEPHCTDRLDDDLDGLIDCLDPDCDGHEGCELGTEVTCDDGLDNDGDGTADCADAGCVDTAYCRVEADCDDGLDDDGDGHPDCTDPGCDDVDGCELGVEASCTDGRDNDGDGTTDCDDADCAIELRCAIAVCPPGTRKHVFDATDVPVTIADNATATSTITIGTAGLVNAVAVQVDIAHTSDGDLTLSLVAPGRTRSLAARRGGSGDNFASTIFTDNVARQVATGAPPFAGPWQPEQSMAGLNETFLAGPWQLRVADGASGNTGTIRGFHILVCECDPATGACEFGPMACRNDVDDDGDGLIDCAEPACATDPSCRPEAACGDNLDDDFDGLIDCRDPDCDGVAGCELGTEATCDDGRDNDADGTVDCRDADCVAAPACEAETNCHDGLDDDGDGLIDCADSGCDGIDGCELGHELSCTDGRDNDADGTVDCADPECAGLMLCAVPTCPAGTIKHLYQAADLPQPIADNATTTSSIAVTALGQVGTIAVAVDLDHSFDGDVTLKLVAPGGTRTLAANRGGPGDNYVGTVFVDAATTVITGGTAPFTGRFRPEQNLAALSATFLPGTWKLTAADNSGGDTGTLKGFQLLVCECDPATGACEYGATACRNDVDDDGDGLIDCAEPECATDVTCIPETACNDRVDQDLDGLIDCRDPDCDGLQGCELGVEVTCGDAADNDADGLIDCFDPDCRVAPVCQVELDCDNGIDDDGDGGADCDDADCAVDLWCIPEASCSDGVDDDGDGALDCADHGCDGIDGCTYGGEHACNDNIDNDSNGVVDCLEPACVFACAQLATTCPAGSVVYGFAAPDLPRVIPTTGPPNIHLASMVSSTTATVGTIALRFSALHAYDSDLALSLISPTGTSIDVTSGNGSSGDNYTSTVFIDSAAAVIGSTGNNSAPFTGSYRPEQAFAALTGQPMAGTWQARLADVSGGDGGSWTEFALAICATP